MGRNIFGLIHSTQTHLIAVQDILIDVPDILIAVRDFNCINKYLNIYVKSVKITFTL